MSTFTPRWGLDLLTEGQAAAEISHNGGQNRTDALLHASMIGWGTNTPPGSPSAGDCYLVGGSPTGIWSTPVSYANKIAAYYGSGWLLITPKAGLRVWDNAGTRSMLYNGSAWVELPGQGVAVANMAGSETLGQTQTKINDLLNSLRNAKVIAT
ncbi:MAG: DUF2793 domain-containing protein [Phycisphaeraceae bacterium]|nr:DUF2793 domain-containing protein [Phycisphaeraceae bacterium]